MKIRLEKRDGYEPTFTAENDRDVFMIGSAVSAITNLNLSDRKENT